MKLKYLMLVTIAMVLINCDRGPKVISTPVNESENNNNKGSKGSTGIFDEGGVSSDNKKAATTGQMSDVHTVVVNEVLPTQKYVYMNVSEGDESYWVATGKQEVEVGGKYFFKGGLLKTNFESREYDRVFDKVYLVSKVVPLNHGQKKLNEQSKEDDAVTEESNKFKLTFDHSGGFVKISELVADPSKYAGKKIKMTGQCTKLNANIMGTNWIHLKDGTKDEYDLVLTSDVAVPEGHIIKVEGTVVVDKDFGAGYKYDIIVEDAIMLN